VTRLRTRFPILILICALALLPCALLIGAGTRYMMVPGVVHLVVVGTAALLAAGAALTMSVCAAKFSDARAVLLGLAFSVMAVFLLVHALATPGVLIANNGVVQVAGALNLPVGGLILAASGLPVLRGREQIRILLRIEVLAVAGLVVVGALALVNATHISAVPAPSSLAAEAIFAVTVGPLVLLCWRSAHTFLLTRRTSDLLVATGVVWLVGAQYGLLNFTMMDAGFWAAHVLEAGGIALVGIPAALDLRYGIASRPLVGDLRADDLVGHEDGFLGGRVRALLVRLAEKDPSTEGHTRRVATLAVQIGEQLGLKEGRLRQLALGGLLHDIGKLSVPNEILCKPSKLSEQEFAEIQRHPEAGRELLKELGGFSPLVLQLVESHHERLDAAGYPNRVAAATLPLEVRVLTVADVYDALTADRVYRQAWSKERALALLHEETGKAFDHACVAALEAVLASEAGHASNVNDVGASAGGAVKPGALISAGTSRFSMR
jgi:HD-GYP domain-containing protein (c-di-GMP phosphodiesterase class II)